MMTSFLDWLGADLRRWQGANALLVTAILGLLDTTRVAFGILILALVVLWSLRCGWRAVQAGPGLHPFSVALAFGPQVFAIALAAAALWLIGQPGWQPVALVIFAGQLVALVHWNNDLAEGRALAVRVPEWMKGVA